MFTDFDIDELKARHPLPDGIKDIVVNREELVKGLNKSAPMIDRYRNGGMPVLRAGGSGQSYEFQLWDCWAWYHGMKAGEAADKDRRSSQMELLRSALVGDDGSDDMLQLSPRDRSDEYEAARRYAETAMAQGTVVYRAEMALLLEGIFGVVRRHLLNLPDVMERRVGLSPEQAEEMEKVSKEAIASLSETLKESNLTVNVERSKTKKRAKAS